MKLQEFQKSLFDAGYYATARPRRPLPSWIATPAFYPALFIYVVKAWSEAHLPNFPEHYWPVLSLNILQLCEGLGASVRIDGFDAGAIRSGPVVWVANHMSQLETYLLPSVCTAFGRVRVIAKSSLARYPLFGRVVRGANSILVSRKNPVEDLRKVLNEGMATIAKGESVLLFPQGTRMPRFDPATFNTLGARLAGKAGVPLVPVAVKTDLLPVGRLLKEFGSVHPGREIRISCGEPVPCDRANFKDAHAAAAAFISAKLGEWSGEYGTPLLAAPAPKDGAPTA